MRRCCCAQFEAFKQDSGANLRTLVTAAEARRAAAGAGWAVEREASVITEGLPDARWEVEFTLSDIEEELAGLRLPAKFGDLLQTQARLLGDSAVGGEYATLPTYAFVAT